MVLRACNLGCDVSMSASLLRAIGTAEPTAFRPALSSPPAPIVNAVPVSPSPTSFTMRSLRVAGEGRPMRSEICEPISR